MLSVFNTNGCTEIAVAVFFFEERIAEVFRTLQSSLTNNSGSSEFPI